jgi:hypothetical protein
MTWAEFQDLIYGLLHKTDSRLWQATHRNDDEPTPQGA